MDLTINLQSLASRRLIVFEGIDGTGKSSQTALLARWLEDQGHEVIRSFEPTNSTFGKQLRASANSGRFSGEEELELFIKDRQEHIETLIAPALKRGAFVLLDRYYFSTMAYQGARGLDISDIRRKNESFAPRPACLIILELGIEEALKRIGVRDGEGNAFEKRENLEACDRIFRSLTDEFIVRIDADQNVDDVAFDVRASVAALL